MPESTKDTLLQLVRDYKQSHPECTYRDYERFKSIFHDKGMYGYEKEIADILQI